MACCDWTFSNCKVSYSEVMILLKLVTGLYDQQLSAQLQLHEMPLREIIDRVCQMERLQSSMSEPGPSHVDVTKL